MPQRSRSVVRFNCAIVSALTLTLFGALAHTQDKPRAGSFAKGKASGPLLTRAELRECLNLQPRLRGLSEEVLAAQTALDTRKSEIAQHDAALKEDLATLDRTSAEAVDTYNARVLAQQQRVEAYNASTPSFNAKVENLQSQRAAFAKSCENRDFDEKDEIAIRKDQQGPAKGQ